jgi:hypothetical protein
MKGESEVRARLNEVVFAEVARRIELTNEKLPHKCTHNYRHPLDARKRVNGEANEYYNRITTLGLPVLQSVGMCMLGADQPENWNGTICDEPIDAKRCPYFTPSKTKEDITKEVQEQLLDGEWVRENLPEAYGLLWVLEDITVPRISWWRKILLRFITPVRPTLEPPFDSKKLLSTGL